jgi:hypothetical protein
MYKLPYICMYLHNTYVHTHTLAWACRSVHGCVHTGKGQLESFAALFFVKNYRKQTVDMLGLPVLSFPPWILKFQKVLVDIMGVISF